MRTSLKKPETVPFSVRASQEEIDEIDYFWKNYTAFTTRSDFVREAINEKMFRLRKGTK